MADNNNNFENSLLIDPPVIDNHDNININNPIKNCGTNCKFCDIFDTSNILYSTSSNRSYLSIIPDHMNADCKSPNTIYLITCLNCSMQYTGETSQIIRERFNVHRNHIKDQVRFCKKLVDHFNEGLCKNADYKVQIVQKCDDDISFQERRWIETQWMLKPRTVYPFGLNDKIDEKTKAEDIIVTNRFSALPRRHQHNKRKRKPFDKNNSIASFMNLLKTKLQSDIKSCMNFIRSVLSSFSKQKSKSLYSCVNKLLEDQGEDFLFAQWYYPIFDIIESKIIKESNPKQKKNPKLRCNLVFVNKGLDFINLAKILRNPVSLSDLPNSISKDDLPMITYTLGNTIRHKIFNHKSFVQDFDTKNIINNISSLPCNCLNSNYRDQHHNHIVTGDLRIVENNKLRKIFTYGPKFREPNKIDWNVCMYD